MKTLVFGAAENMKKFFTSASRTISNAVQRNHEELKDSEDLIEEEIPILAELGPAALFRYHLNDWLQIVLVILLWLLCFLVPPFQRHVGEKNFATPELRYPFKSNTIPFQAVPVMMPIPSFFPADLCWFSLSLPPYTYSSPPFLFFTLFYVYFYSFFFPFGWDYIICSRMNLVVLSSECSEQVIAVFVPLVVIVGIFIKRRNFRDLHHALLGSSL